MKEIKAIIQPFMLDKVLDALREVEGLPGCIVSHVKTYPRARDDSRERGFEPHESAKLEIVIAEPLVKKVVEVIQKNAHTGNKGDGKIFVIECTDVIRIRTAEHGADAI